MALSRHQLALNLARQIALVERCPVLTALSIENIERSLADYRMAGLSDARQSIVNEPMDAPAKQRVLAILTAAIQDESK